MAKPTQYTATCTLSDGTVLELKRGSARTYTHAVVVEFERLEFDREAYLALEKRIRASGVYGKEYLRRERAAMAKCLTGNALPGVHHQVMGFAGSLELAEKSSHGMSKYQTVRVLRRHIVPVTAA